MFHCAQHDNIGILCLLIAAPLAMTDSGIFHYVSNVIARSVSLVAIERVGFLTR